MRTVVGCASGVQMFSATPVCCTAFRPPWWRQEYFGKVLFKHSARTFAGGFVDRYCAKAAAGERGTFFDAGSIELPNNCIVGFLQ